MDTRLPIPDKITAESLMAAPTTNIRCDPATRQEAQEIARGIMTLHPCPRATNEQMRANLKRVKKL